MKNNNHNKNQLREQEAPLKNTDRAFVRVNKEGHQEFPESPENERQASEEKTISDHQNKNDER